MTIRVSNARQVAAAAERLLAAAATRQPCAPIRDLIGATDVQSAYAVQKIVNEQRVANGTRMTGRKIGLTSPRVRAQIGVDQPDFGALFDDAAYGDAAVLPFKRTMSPKAEAEIAFVLEEDLEHGPLDVAHIRRAIAYAVPAIEIADSRIANWDITFADTVADNASFGAYILGTTKRTLKEFEPAAVKMQMLVDGNQVSDGNSTDCLGDPLNAVVWLAQKSRELGAPLRAGEVILSGALGPMANCHAGAKIRAEIDGLGTVSAEFDQ